MTEIWVQPPGDLAQLAEIEAALPVPPEPHFWRLELKQGVGEARRHWWLNLQLRRQRPDPGPWWSKLRSPSVLVEERVALGPHTPLTMLRKVMQETDLTTTTVAGVARSMLLELEAQLHLTQAARRKRDRRR